MHQSSLHHHGYQGGRDKVQKAGAFMSLCVWGFRLMGQWRAALFSNWIVIQSSNSVSWSIKQLSGWWWPASPSRACVCSLSLTRYINHYQSSNCSECRHPDRRSKCWGSPGMCQHDIPFAVNNWEYEREAVMQTPNSACWITAPQLCLPPERWAQPVSQAARLRQRDCEVYAHTLSHNEETHDRELKPKQGWVERMLVTC